MTELQGTQASTEDVSTNKKVLTESKTEVKESKPTLKGIFNEMLSEAEQVTIQPASQKTQVIKQGQKTLGTVENPQLAQQIKQSIGKGEMTLAGDELQEDDMAEGLDPAQKQKLKSLIYAYRDATDPFGSEYDLDPSVVIDRIRQEFGDKIADTISQGPSMHFPRPGHVSGVYDPLANKFSPRVTKLGKINRQDAETMKRSIKQQHGMTESKLTEKAVSKSQQQAAGAALAAKRGDTPKSKLTGASKEMAKMPAKELEKFAKTKHKGLPVKKEKTDESSSGVRIVHNKLLGGWFIVRGPHQTPISGKFSSKEEAEKSLKQKEKPTANEAAMPTHDGDFGAGLGAAGRSQTTLEAKKTVKKDDKAEKAGKKVTKDIEYDEKVKDKIHGKKRKAEDDKAEKAGKKVAKDIEYDMKKKKVNESMNHNKLEAARLRGKAHALAKESYNCKYDEGTEERNAYHEGFKEGLDECYGMMPIQGLVVGEEMPATVPGMASNAMPAMEADMEEGNAFTAALARTPKGGKFTVGGKTFTDRTSYDTKVDEMDIMAFEAWDRELNELLNEGKMKDLDMDLGNAKGEPALSDAKFKEKYGKTKAEMKKSLSSDSKNKTPVKEGISVSVSKGQQGSPDSVTVSAQDQDADALLAMIKQAGLGLFGGDDQQASSYGAPVSQDQVTAPQGGDVGDHDSMMSLIKKMSSGSNDYEDEESHDDSTCPGCGSSDCGCDDESDSKALVVGEDETEDQMEFEVAEANAPDSDQAETTADENAEAEQDKALAQAAQQNKTDTFNEGGDGGEASEEDEELTEWANDAGYTGSENTKDNTFEEDIDFMTRVISGGLNGPKKDQTTLPHTRVKVDESIQALNEWKKLSGI